MRLVMPGGREPGRNGTPARALSRSTNITHEDTMRIATGALAATLIAFGAAQAQAQALTVQYGGGYGTETRIVRERPAVREVEVDRGYRRGPVVEERVIRRPARTRTVCRTVVRERTNPYTGVTVRRPTEVCREQVVSRRFVD